MSTTDLWISITALTLTVLLGGGHGLVLARLP
jgi:hypothetical protein